MTFVDIGFLSSSSEEAAKTDFAKFLVKEHLHGRECGFFDRQWIVARILSGMVMGFTMHASSFIIWASEKRSVCLDLTYVSPFMLLWPLIVTAGISVVRESGWSWRMGAIACRIRTGAAKSMIKDDLLEFTDSSHFFNSEEANRPKDLKFSSYSKP